MPKTIPLCTVIPSEARSFASRMILRSRGFCISLGDGWPIQAKSRLEWAAVVQAVKRLAFLGGMGFTCAAEIKPAFIFPSRWSNHRQHSGTSPHNPTYQQARGSKEEL